jgi:hypothetical protein
MRKTEDTAWYYWEAGTLVSLIATAGSRADSLTQLAYGLLTLLFLFGMAQGLRTNTLQQERR